jgi:hypothetical protein
MSKADNANEWLQSLRKANNVHFGNWAVKIRAKLGLPPSGEGC